MATEVEVEVAPPEALEEPTSVEDSPKPAEPKKKTGWLRRRKVGANGEKSRKPPGEWYP